MNKTDLKGLCQVILETGMKRFPVSLGIVSRIYQNKYEVYSLSSSDDVLKYGDVFDLDNVYCRDVYKNKKTIAITEIDNVPGMKLYPLYELIPLEIYISSPINVNGQVWGTLNFSGFEISEIPFSTDDIQFNEDQAGRIASAISNLE